MKILGVIGGVVGAIIVILAGIDMTAIQSEAGDTIMEAYYHAMGRGFIGLGIFCIMLICVVAFRRVQPAKDDEEEGREEEQKENADAYHKGGYTYGEKGEYEKAIADYNKAIELNPNDADAYYNRGCTYGETGEYEKAIADFDKVIQLNPSDAGAYYNRGLAYKEKGDLRRAASDLEKCIGLPSDPELTKDAQQALSEVRNSPEGP